MKMNREILIKNGKEIVIATSAAISLGIGTSITHQVLARASEIDAPTSMSADLSGTKTVTDSTDTDPSVSGNSNTTPEEATESGDNGSDSTPETKESTTNPEPETSKNETGDTGSESLTTPTTPSPSADVAQPEAESISSSDPAPSPQEYTSGGFKWVKNDDDTSNSSVTLKGLDPNNSTVTSVNVPSTVDIDGSTYNVTGIGSLAFFSNKSLTSVILNDGLTSIGDNAFAYCDNLNTVDFSKNNTLKTIGYAAFASDPIESLVLPNTVESIGESAFANNSALETLTLPDSLQTIGDKAFQFNINLTSVIFNKGLKTIGKQAFYSNKSLASIIFNDGLTSIGSEAFGYCNDSDNPHLLTVDFSKNSTLKTIGDIAFYSDSIESLNLPSTVTSIGMKAFGFNNALETLTLPDSLQTIGEQAFVSNPNLKSVFFDKSLTSIGNGAFEYDGISGDLTIPSNVTSIGDQAFFSNQLTGINYSGSDLTLGNETFKSNHIVNINAPKMSIKGKYGSGMGGYQTFTFFTDSKDSQNIKISDLFDINVEDGDEQGLGITDLSDGVEYSKETGIFTVPSDTKSFSFHWSVGPEYNGQYNVIFGNPIIKAVDSTHTLGSPWTPDENFMSCTLEDGTEVPLTNIKFSVKNSAGQGIPTVDVNTAGKYEVEYRYKTDSANYSTTVTVSVQKNQGTYRLSRLSGTGSSIYSGTPKSIEGSYKVTFSNDDNTYYETKPGDVEFVNSPATDVGTYDIQLSDQGLKAIESLDKNNTYNWTADKNTSKYIAPTYVIEKLPITITADNSAKSSDESDPTLTAEVSGGEGDAIKGLTYTLSRESGESVGTYPITVTYTDTDNPNYEITVESGTFTITGIASDDTYTMNVGESAPTAADFHAIAYDVNGPVSAISLDLNGADLSKSGDYTVTLSTADGMKKDVILHVTGGNSGGTTTPTTPVDPVDPDNGDHDNGSTTVDPVDPTDPVKPVDPVDPTKPTDPDNPVDPDTPVNPEGPNESEGSVAPINPSLPTESGNKINGAVTSESNVDGNAVITPMGNKQVNTELELPSSTDGKLPQTGEKTSLMATISGILLSSLSLIGIDFKRRKNNR
ncbi:adhesion exoprotein [Companilactobacillus tucceti DSM 20183]|uniref:Adhesion exoprotein n=1 Tax=Companilactobacillus tucceti DSM 20183 TaxID=1423811 RepID=A0A0R1IWG5_9LACO|nr:leucine-rich repeat protein [Companilactobacillus tucceti]KRK63568.1 adhesion exoprotein [Companilactobacillus tucceti DSM 20183]